MSSSTSLLQFSNTNNNGINQYAPYFGELPLTPQNGPRFQMSHEDFPAAYEGRSEFLTNVITGLTTDNNSSWILTIMLPLIFNNSPNFTWNEFKFNRTLTSETPEEGVSRLIRYEKSARNAQSVRRGQGIMLEYDFTQTEYGREIYQMQLLQLLRNVQITNELQAITAVMNSHRDEKLWMEMYGNNNKSAYERIQDEINAWGIVQKGENHTGLLNLNGRVQILANRNRVTIDMFIFPPGFRQYIDVTQAQTPAVPYIYGGNNSRKGSTVLSKEGLGFGFVQGIPAYEMPIFDIFDKDTDTTPLDSVHTIGEYNIMADEYNDYLNYTADARDLVVFDENRDDMVKIKFKDAIKNSFRFDEKGNIKTIDDKGFGENFQDMFYKKGDDDKWKPIETFQELKDNGSFDEEVLERVSNTIICAARRKAGLVTGGGGAGTPGSTPTSVITEITNIFKDINKGIDNPKKVEVSSTDINGEVTTAFLALPVKLSVLLKMVDNAILCPISFLLFKPWMTYRMSSIVAMKGGISTGALYFGNSNAMTGQDNSNKTITVHYTYRNAAVVTAPRNIFIASAAFYKEYLGGSNSKFYNEDSLNKMREDHWVSTSEQSKDRPSFVAVMIPYCDDAKKYSIHMDITGRFSTDLNHDNKTRHYETCDFYNEMTGWAQIIARHPGELFRYDMTSPNTIVSRTFQQGYSGATKFENTKICLGHHGPNTYKGCAQIRNGQNVAYRPINYVAPVPGR